MNRRVPVTATLIGTMPGPVPRTGRRHGNHTRRRRPQDPWNRDWHSLPCNAGRAGLLSRYSGSAGQERLGQAPLRPARRGSIRIMVTVPGQCPAAAAARSVLVKSKYLPDSGLPHGGGRRYWARPARRRTPASKSETMQHQTTAALIAASLMLCFCVFLLYNSSDESIKSTGLLIGHGFLGEIFGYYRRHPQF